MQDGYYVSLNGKIDPNGPLTLEVATTVAETVVRAGEPAAWVEKYKDGERVEWDCEKDDWKS